MTYDWTKEKYYAEFVQHCKEQGFDPDDEEFGNPTLIAKLFFYLGVETVQEDMAQKLEDVTDELRNRPGEEGFAELKEQK